MPMTQTAGKPEGIILAYVNEQNRPLNTQMISDALQKNGIKKTAVQKIVDNLADSGKISFKEYGKQKIYMAKQDQFEIPDKSELDSMTKENDSMLQQVKSARGALAEIEADIRAVESNLTDSQIKESTKKLEVEISEMEAKVVTLREGKVLINPDERQAIEKSYSSRISCWRKRKRIFKDLWDMITEAVPRNLGEFKEELGIEFDEDVGSKLDDYCNLAVKKLKR